MVRPYASFGGTRDDTSSKQAQKGWRARVTWHNIAIIAVVFLIILGVVAAVANQFFYWKIEGTWMWQKAGLNLWDIWFVHGVYWWMYLFYMGLFTGAGLLLGAVNWVSKRGSKPPEQRHEWDDEEELTRMVLRFRLLVPISLLVGFIVAVFFSNDAAVQFLIVEEFIKHHGLTWWGFISTTYGDSVRYILAGHYPTGSFLVGNAVVFEFLYLVFLLAAPLLGIATVLIFAQVFTVKQSDLGVVVLRNILIIVTIWACYIGILGAPLVVADITLPIYSWWRTIAVSGIAAVTFVWALSCRYLSKHTKRRLAMSILAVGLVIVLISAPFVQATFKYSVFQNWDANKNVFEFPYKITPHIDYVKWAADLNNIKTIGPGNFTVPTGGEDEIFRSIRTISYSGAIQQMTYAYSQEVGQPWMKLAIESDGNGYIYGPMIVWSGNHEYWILPTSPVLPEQASSSDADIGRRYLYTHSEAILAIDAASGEVVSINKVFPQLDPQKIAMYYGLGGLFKDQNMVFLRIGTWAETHMSGSTASKYYDGQPDYVFGENDKVLGMSERFWYFLLQFNLAFAQGTNGQSISVLQHRDVLDRVSKLLIPGLEIEKEPSTGHEIPYMVVGPDGTAYFAFTVYINRPIDTSYSNTNTLGENVNTNGNFRRLFAVVLVNAHDGTVKGYKYGDWNENFITQFYASFYQPWTTEMPSWLLSQVRFPKSLAYDIMDLYNTYRIDSKDWDSWHKTLNMYDFPVDKSWNYFSNQIDDLRYVPVFYNGKLVYAGVRIVELYQQKSEQWVPRSVAGMYVFFGDGEKVFVPFQNALSLQIILDSMTTNTHVLNILTTRKQTSGQVWDAGNLNLYIINGRPVYFLPYYISASTVLNVGMVVAADGVSGKVGAPYVLQDTRDPAEIAVAPFRAYSLLMSGIVLSGEQQRIDGVRTELTKAGFEVRTPLNAPSANVAYLYANVTFSTPQDWDTVNATLHQFMKDCLVPDSVKVVNIWIDTVGAAKVIYVGALIPTSQGIELHVMTIQI